MRKAFSVILAVLLIVPVSVFPGCAAADDTSGMETFTTGSKPVSFLLPEGAVSLGQQQLIREESCNEFESLMFRYGSLSISVVYNRIWGSEFDTFVLGYFGVRDVIPAEMESVVVSEFETAFTTEGSGVAEYGLTEADSHPAVWALLRQEGLPDTLTGAVIIVSGGAYIRVNLSMQYASGKAISREDQEIFLRILESFRQDSSSR